MRMDRGRRISTPYPLSQGFVGIANKTRNVISQEPFASVEERSCRLAAPTHVLEGSENKSWKNKEERRGAKCEGRSLVERYSEGYGDIQRLSQGLRSLLREGSTLDGHVERGDLVDEPAIFPSRGAIHDISQGMRSCTTRDHASGEQG